MKHFTLFLALASLAFGQSSTLSVNPSTGAIRGPVSAATFKTANDLGGAGAFSELTDKPTTLSGYGITDAQPLDADLTTYAGITPSANVQSILGGANHAAIRTLLDLEAGTDFLAYPTGTPTGAKYLRDDNTWQAITGGDVTLTGTNVYTAGSSTFNAGTTVAVNGTFNGTPTAGTLDLSAVTVTLGSTTVDTLNVTAFGTGTLLPANGGTGATSLTSNNLIIGAGTSAVTFLAPGTSGNVVTSNGTAWTSATPSAGGGATISDTAPGSPTAGDQWWDSTAGVMRIYYNDGTSSQWVDATPIPPSPVPAGPWQRVTWVDASLGSDSTGQVGRPDRPFAEIKAAYDACLVAGGRWLVHIRASNTEYTSTGMAFGDATSTVSFYYDAGAVHRITGSGDAFVFDAASAGKDCYIMGSAKVFADAATTGRWLDYTSWVAPLRIRIEADQVINAPTWGGTARATSIIYMQVSPVEPSTINIRELDAIGGEYSYFRLGGEKCYFSGSAWRGVSFDNANVSYFTVDFLTNIIVGTNGFAAGQYWIRNMRGPKGTSMNSAIKVRMGIVHIFNSVLEQSLDANGTAALEIASNASTAAGEMMVSLQDCILRVWGSTTYTADVIKFSSVHANFRVRLKDCMLLQTNTAGAQAYSISATAAQEIEVLGLLHTNLPLDPDVTLKSGTGTVVTSTGIWTDW